MVVFQWLYLSVGLYSMLRTQIAVYEPLEIHLSIYALLFIAALVQLLMDWLKIITYLDQEPCIV